MKLRRSRETEPQTVAEVPLWSTQLDPETLLAISTGEMDGYKWRDQRNDTTTAELAVDPTREDYATFVNQTAREAAAAHPHETMEPISRMEALLLYCQQREDQA